MVMAISQAQMLSSRTEGLLVELVWRATDWRSVPQGKANATADAAGDLEDIRQSRHGDGDAYRRLIERHQKHVGRILWRFSRDRRVHEELVQDVFVQAYLNLDDYRGRAPFAHWLARIATHIGYGHWRRSERRRRIEHFSLEQWDQAAGETPLQTDASEAGELVHKLLAQLPPRDRLVLTLRYLEECSIAETAERTGWTQTMVKVQTFRAKKKLERLFQRIEKETT